MFSIALVIFREVFEIALIVGVLMAATRGVPQRTRWVWSGCLAGIVGSVVVAFFADTIAQAAQGMGQEILNAFILLAAAGLIGWTVIWMNRHGRELTQHLKQVGHALVKGERPLYTLAGVVALAVLREGSEIVMFTYSALVTGGRLSELLLGSLFGGLGGAAVGVVLYYGLIKVPTKQIFTVTSWLLMFLVAGMASQAFGFLTAAGIVPELVPMVWDTSAILAESSFLGKTLHVLAGYTERPSGIQAIVYILTLGGLAVLLRTYDQVKRHEQKVVAGVLMAAGLLSCAWTGPVFAAETTLPGIIVTAQREKQLADELLAVQDGKIYSGKKTSTVDLAQRPAIINNNYRQALEKTPGLLVSEETTPLVSIGYRGLAPDRVQFTQVLKDGVPITADMYGYPEAYYTPPFQVVDHIDFIRGGAGLLYGPQPGGALNFVTKEPYAEGPLSIVEENAAGSHGLYSNYTGLSGTAGNAGYFAYFHHRQSQGFRATNSQSEVYSGGSKVQWQAPSDARWGLSFDLYNEKHGEPGGLTRANFDADPDMTTRLNDHFELNRYAGVLSFEKDLDESKSLYWKMFGGYYQRLSWRQRGGGFGTLPSGASSFSNEIQDQEFYTAGSEARFKQTYEAFGLTDHALTAGALYYHSTSPRSDKRGTAADSDDGALRQKNRRTMNAMSLFAENMFNFGRLTVTPGVRLENIWQGIKEKGNLDKTSVALADEREHDFVPLFGLGTEYEIDPKVKAYANISQSYRPKTFAQAVPTGTNQTVNGDLEEGKGWQTDIGVRGRPAAFYNWDLSYFLMRFEDQIGTSGTTVDNVGDAVHQGIELANQLDLIGAYDALKGTSFGSDGGKLNVFANAMVLEAHFSEGPNKGKTPQYAPDFVFKTGLEYVYQDRGKVRLSGTFVDDHFGNDTNTTQFVVPSYKVWDLTAEWKVYKDTVSLFGGINNLFNERYFARVTSAGIDPADGRNYFAGAKMVW